MKNIEESSVFSNEPGLAIDTRVLPSHNEACELLADSILVLIERGWAFKSKFTFERPKDYAMRRWYLSSEAATLWNMHVAPIVKSFAETQESNLPKHLLLTNALASKGAIATEVVLSMALLLCEVWKESLLFAAIRAFEESADPPRRIESKQRSNVLAPLNEWRAQCMDWVDDVGQAAYEQMIQKRRDEAKRKAERRAQEEKQEQLARDARQRALVMAKLRAEIARQEAVDLEIHRKRVEADAHKAETERQAHHAALRNEYAEKLKTDYIAAAKVKEFSNGHAVLEESVRRQLEVQFVAGWLADSKNIVKKFKPNDEQLLAISRIEPRLLIRARAGSGKTSTIVARVVFLIRHCRVAPKTILIFAFNKAAAEKIERDLVVALNLTELADAEALNLMPVVQTFDAFAQAVSGLRSLEPSEQHLIFQEAIEETLAENPDQVKSAMLQFFRAEWDRAELGILPGRDTVLGARRSEGALITLGGEQVKSRGEHRIANWLFEHNIPYRYERSVKQKGIFWVPDFTLLPDDPHPIIVEYLGLMGDPAYDEKTSYKKSKIAEIAEETRPTVIWLAPESTTAQSDIPMPFIGLLTNNLALRNITPKKLTDDEIWEKIKISAIAEFRKIVISVVGRAKQARWSADKLAREGQRSDVPLLLAICAAFMAKADRINTTGRYSYAEICWQAGDLLKVPSSPLKDLRNQNKKWRQIDLSEFNEIIVDEFQDFSMRYNEIVNGVLQISAPARLFVVGDDWQAINRYNGSDATYITEWAGPEVVLSENHRSLPQIVSLGNSLMPHRGPLAKAKEAQGTAKLLRMKLEELRPSELERNAVRDFTDLRPDVVAAISRLVIPHLREKKHVAVLARAQHELDLSKGGVLRKNPLEKLLRDLAGPASGHVDVSTVHNYKGQEADVVILLADNFPLLHPHRVIYEVFGDTEAAIKEDERRLLYVGITRAKQTLYFLTGIKERSDGLEKSLTLKPGSWTDFPAVGTHIESSDKRMITLQGWATSSFKEHLKVSGFKYSGPPLRRWERVLLARESIEGAIEAILAAPWFPASPLEDELTIQVLDSGDTVLAEKTFQLRGIAHSADHISKSGTDDLPF